VDVQALLSPLKETAMDKKEVLLRSLVELKAAHEKPTLHSPKS